MLGITHGREGCDAVEESRNRLLENRRVRTMNTEAK
jgi:hypothetical protein